MKLWHDDIRRPPDLSWFWARTNKEAIWFLVGLDREGTPAQEASLDHDMGMEDQDPDADPSTWLLKGDSPDGDGVDLAYALYHLRIAPPKITIHSWNDAGAARMAGILREAGSDVTINPFRPPRMDDHTYAGMFNSWPR